MHRDEHAIRCDLELRNGYGGYDLFVGRTGNGEALVLKLVFVDDQGRG